MGAASCGTGEIPLLLSFLYLFSEAESEAFASRASLLSGVKCSAASRRVEHDPL